MTIAISIGIMLAALFLAALSIAGGWWNLVDAIALVMHTAAMRGRARSMRMQARLGQRWARAASPKIFEIEGAA